MSKKEVIAAREITFNDDIKKIIKEALRNHVILYNHSLELLNKNPQLELKELKKQVFAYAKEKNYYPIIKDSLSIELYYLYKKFKRNIKHQKLITDIQYLTFILLKLTKKLIKITVDKEKKQALMINSLFEYFEEIDKLKGKDIPRVQKMIKEIQENARAFKAEVKAPPIMGEKVQACTKVKEDTKTIADLLQEDLEKRCKDRFKHEEKSRNSGKTQEMKDYVFFGIDFAKGKGKTQAFNVGFKNGKIVIQEI